MFTDVQDGVVELAEMMNSCGVSSTSMRVLIEFVMLQSAELQILLQSRLL